MYRRAGLASVVALLAPVVFASTAYAGTAPTGTVPPVEPPPAPGLPVEVNSEAKRAAAGATVAPARPGRAWTMTQYRAQTIRWSAEECTVATTTTEAQVGESGLVQCATIKTPLDWSDLSRGSMDLHVSRVKAAGAKARTLMVNPGGPGAAAGPMAVSTAVLKPALRRTHHIVGVDPRGTGGSTPLDCMPDELGVADSRDTSPTNRAASQALTKAFVEGCVEKHGTFLPHITTRDTVSDHDLVRQLVAGPRSTVDWFGVSGGSWMGAWYAQLYPTSLGRVVLDANTEFTSDWRTSFAEFPMGFQRRFEGQFLPWMARHGSTYGGGSTVTQTRSTYERVRAAAGQGKVTGMRPDDVDGIVMMLLYDDATFPYAAQFLAGTDQQLRATGTADPALPVELLASMQEADPSMLTVRTAIICNDTAFPRTATSFEEQFRTNIRRFPLTAGSHDLVLSPCAHWPYEPKTSPRIDGSRGPMKLMVQTQYDPATPVEGARRAHRANATTRLLSVTGQGSHGGYLTENACVDRVVTGYLTKGTLPNRDTSCAGTPLPGDTRLHAVTWTPRR